MDLFLGVLALTAILCFAVFIVLIPITFFHELAHFLVARYFGFAVKEFSLGAGTTFFEKKIGSTNVVLKFALGLQGYITMDYNVVGYKEMDDRKLLGTICTCLAGPLTNIFMAAICLFFIKASPFIILFCLFSFSVGMANLVPSGNNDGRIALSGIKEYFKRKK